MSEEKQNGPCRLYNGSQMVAGSQSSCNTLKKRGKNAAADMVTGFMLYLHINAVPWMLPMAFSVVGSAGTPMGNQRCQRYMTGRRMHTHKHPIVCI